MNNLDVYDFYLDAYVFGLYNLDVYDFFLCSVMFVSQEHILGKSFRTKPNTVIQKIYTY